MFFPRLESWVLVGLLAVGGATWAFLELADEVIEGETRSMDQAVLLLFRTPGDRADPIGPGWIEEMARDFTALGGVGVLTFLICVVSGFFWLRGSPRTALFTLAASGSGLGLSILLKHGFDRPRPDLVPHESFVHTASFPSGHATMAAVIYLTLAALLARTQTSTLLRLYVVGVAVAVTIMVGVSRIYLGVHWPSDVLAGWTIGAAWALLFWTLARWLQQHGDLEQRSG